MQGGLSCWSVLINASMQLMNNKILIIDEDMELTQLLKEYLSIEGYDTTVVHDGVSGIKHALNKAYDAIILEASLPQMNGFNLLKAIREHSDTPVLMLTDRGDDIDRLIGLELGADDYLLKPCNPQELIARLKTIFRRTQKNPIHRPIITKHDVVMDCAKRHVTVSGKSLDLTNAEFNILEMLIKSPGQAYSKEELTEYALGRKYTAYDRSIDVHISNLRTKLGNNQHGNPLLKTVRGFGYLFDCSDLN